MIYIYKHFYIKGMCILFARQHYSRAAVLTSELLTAGGAVGRLMVT